MRYHDFGISAINASSGLPPLSSGTVHYEMIARQSYLTRTGEGLGGMEFNLRREKVMT